MYSQCPECQARFRVTAEALRAARGTVRCGRCGSAFDALERLSDSIPPVAGASAEASDRGGAALVSLTPDAVVTTEYHFSADDLEKVFIDARDWQKRFGTGRAGDGPHGETEPAGAGAEPPVVEVDENDDVEDITLEGKRIRIETLGGFDIETAQLDSTDEFEALREVPEAAAFDEGEGSREKEIGIEARVAELPGAGGDVASQAGSAPSVAAIPESVTPEPLAPPPAPLAAQRWRREPDEEVVPLDEAAGDERRGWPVLAWTLGSLVLALALLAQLTHYYRQDLVRHPQIGPPLRAAYERLGLPLSPNWNLAAFELRQWGNDAAASTDGRMSVRASLTNRAGFAQPHPVLRLELEDRFGEPVAVRDFEPGEYLKDPSQATRMMGAGATTEAEFLIADPGPDAVGYRLDICMRESATLLRCAQGQG